MTVKDIWGKKAISKKPKNGFILGGSYTERFSWRRLQSKSQVMTKRHTRS